MIKKHKEIIIIVGIFTLIRLLVSTTFDLGVDEAHYVLYAKYLDWSYVDHPPLVGWIHALFKYILGSGELSARLSAGILFAGVSFLSYRYILSFSGSKKIALTGVLALNASFLLNAMSIMLLPDCILLALIFPIMEYTIKVEQRGSVGDFLLLGLFLGIAGLAKYTAILLVPPILIYLIMKKRYDRIFSPYMVLAGMLAVLMVTPVLWWNIQHDFISFRYQTGHVLGPSAISLEKCFASLAAQFGAYSPFFFLIAFYGFIKGLRHPDDRIRLALLFGGVMYVFFLYASFYETGLPHWTSVFYLLFIPIGIFCLMESSTPFKRKFLKVSLWFSLIVTLLIYAELSLKWFSFPDYKSPFRDIVGYESIVKEASNVFKANSTVRKGIAANNWTMGSRIMYYSLPYTMPVFIIDDRKDQFDLWQQESPEGYDLLFVNTYFNHLDLKKSVQCDQVRSVKTMDIRLNGGKVDTIEYVWCTNYRGMKP